MKSRMNEYPTSLSCPIDSTAARVTSKGTHYEGNLHKYQGDVWETPPPTEHYYQTKNMKPSIIGERHDRIVIVGYLGSNNNGSVWLARCDCGLYCTRNGGKWRKWTEGKQNSCPRCNSRDGMIRSYNRKKIFEITGQHVDD